MNTCRKMGPLWGAQKSTYRMSFCALNKTGSAPPSARFTATRHSLDAAAPNSVPSKFAVCRGGWSFSSDVNARSVSGL
jgi:hypothetical protein